ncbi:vesicle-associated membrane protein 8 [Gorgonomyces haynaldii]|nr:vesicle-associated membrane protein 8 [Gorgonomyces haynaldii]
MSSKTQDVQNQVDEVVGIMQNNINKAMLRGEQLDTLQNKTEDLQQSSLQFKRGANQVRKEMWWKDMKLKLIIGVIVAIVLIIIIVVATQPK